MVNQAVFSNHGIFGTQFRSYTEKFGLLDSRKRILWLKKSRELGKGKCGRLEHLAGMLTLTK